MMIEVWHADSLAGPMSEMKKAFEARNPDIMDKSYLRPFQGTG